MRNILSRAALLVAACSASLAALPARAADSSSGLSGASILMYHRFGEDRIPSTNIRLEQFDAHLAELTSGRYRVLPLPEIVAKLRKGEALPDRTVALTADDAYLSIATEGWPRIKKAGLPFTVFVATEPVTSRLRGYMTWDDVRRLRDEGVTIGAHSHTHFSYATLKPDEVRDDLAKSAALFKQELGAVPALFAYPFGEWNSQSRAIVEQAGFQAAFGQHSGVMHAGQDFFWQPRFPMNETYGDVKRLRQAIEALPFPASDIEPGEVMLRLGQAGKPQPGNPPALRFSLPAGLKYQDRMSCYPSHQSGLIPVKPIAGRSADERRYEVKPATPFPEGRGRISCTLPTDESGRFRWFGIQFVTVK